MSVEVGILIGIVGCFVGLAGWLSGRDKRISRDAEWRGGVNSKLDTIHNDIGGVCADIRVIQSTLTEHGQAITAVAESSKQAHKRIDEHIQTHK